MSKLRSNTSIELEIQALLMHHGTADFAADALLKKYENEKLTLAEFETIASFLFNCGFYSSLLNFIITKLRVQNKISWAYLAETLKQSTTPINLETKKLILEVATDHIGLPDLARSSFLDDIDPKLVNQRQARKKLFIDKSLKIRKDGLQEAEVFRSQGLHEQEIKTIEKLNAMFPNDPEIQERIRSLQGRQAEEIFSQREKQKQAHAQVKSYAQKKTQNFSQRKKNLSNLFIPYHEPLDPETQKQLEQVFAGMVEKISQIEDGQFLAEDFAIALLTWEDEEAALKILDLAPPTISSDWLKAEILLSARRFLELLSHLDALEGAYGNDPESIFSISYLRAQALWGLHQKEKAIDILQGMIVSRPQYRAAHSLLNQWKEDFHE